MRPLSTWFRLPIDVLWSDVPGYGLGNGSILSEARAVKIGRLSMRVTPRDSLGVSGQLYTTLSLTHGRDRCGGLVLEIGWLTLPPCVPCVNAFDKYLTRTH